MSHHASAHDPSFEPLERAEAERLELLINEAARTDSVLMIDPDRGIDGVAAPRSEATEDGITGPRRFRRHFAANQS